MDQLTTTTETRPDLRREELLALAGQVANEAAAGDVAADYLSRLASHTRRTQAAGLALFADFLDQAHEALGAGLRDYAGAVADFPAGSGASPAAWRGVTWGLVDRFARWALAEGYAVATVNNRLAAVKRHAGLAVQAGAISAEEGQKIRAVRGYGRKQEKRIDENRPVTRVGDKKAEHVSLTQAQAWKLKWAHDLTSPQGRRDCLLMCLLLDHGLRVSEVAGLVATDFDLKRGELRFYRPKVDKQQTHRLTADAERAAQGYFAQDAPALGRILLASKKGGELTRRPMSARGITKRVWYLGRELLGIVDPPLSAHDCRHYWATDAARNQTDPFALQEAGGWSSLAMPRRYVEDAKIANQAVKLSVDRGVT
jgi:integrase